MHTLLISLLLAAWMPSTPPVHWSFSAQRQADGSVAVHCDAVLDAGWHIYATVLPGNEGPIPTAVRILPSTGHGPASAIQEPIPMEEYDPNFAMVVRYHDGSPRFTTTVSPTVPSTSLIVKGEVEYMVCNDKTCLPPVIVPFEVTIEAEPAKP
ncbi:MAG: hypothetical protein IPO05_00830 [Flavobacteriales bacterium]|nr:hypothetical protein [Flavobacteriales bacterium]